ncbi:MAG: LamG domain-containing protein [Oscillatoria sp. SIO1A7]|nr:LamG domain-containing protein [Oscillatoria sp. SIO1A7]
MIKQVTELTIPRYAPVWDTILKFNGASDYVEIPNNEDIDFASKQDFTIAFWVLAEKQQKNTSNSDNGIVEKWSSSKGYPYAIRYLNEKAGDNAGKIVAAIYDGTVNASIMSKTKVDDGQFHYVAFVRKTEGKNTKLYLYIDGEEEASADDNSTGDTKNNSPLYLGRRGDNTNYFTGCIGRLLIFNKALEKEGIHYCMEKNSTILPQDSPLLLKGGLVGAWRCNEGYGTIAFDYAKSNNGILGGSDGENARPVWVVSTIPMPLDFAGIHNSIKMPEFLKGKEQEADIPKDLSLFVRK